MMSWLLKLQLNSANSFSISFLSWSLLFVIMGCGSLVFVKTFPPSMERPAACFGSSHQVIAITAASVEAPVGAEEQKNHWQVQLAAPAR